MVKTSGEEHLSDDENKVHNASRRYSSRNLSRRSFFANCPGSAPPKMTKHVPTPLKRLNVNSVKTPDKDANMTSRVERSSVKSAAKLTRSSTRDAGELKVEPDVEGDSKLLNPVQLQKIQLKSVVDMEFVDNGYPKTTFSPVLRKFFEIKQLNRVEKTSGRFKSDADKMCVFCHESCRSDCDDELITCHGTMEGVSKKVPCRSKFHKNCAIRYNSNAFLFQYAARVECQNKLLCPLHCCAACNVNHKKQSAYIGPLTECALCLRSFHTESCIPSGSKPLDVRLEIGEKTTVVEMMICPAHYEAAKPQYHINSCRECSKTKDLVKCVSCVRSFHVKCHDVMTIDGKPNPMDKCEMCLCQDVIRYNVPVLVKWEGGWWLAITRDWYHYPTNSREKTSKFECVGYTVVEWPNTENNGVPLTSIIPVSEMADLVSYYIRPPITKKMSHQQYWESVLKNFNPFENIPNVLKEVNRVMTTSKSSKKVTYRCPETGLCKCTGKNRCTTDDCCYVQFDCECPPECSEEGRVCHNRNISEKFQNPGIEYRVAEKNKGFGLFATAKIKRGDFIAEYVGEVIDSVEKEKRRRVIEISKDFQANHYMLKTVDNMTIDATTVGNIARYINHSCDPNARAFSRRIFVKYQNDYSLYEARSCIKAIRDIAAGEEITFNYRMDGDASLPSCACGAKNCTGFISVNVIKQEIEEEDESSDDEEVERKPLEVNDRSSIDEPPKKIAKRRQTHLGISRDSLNLSSSSRRSIRVQGARLKIAENEENEHVQPKQQERWKYVEYIDSSITRRQKELDDASSKRRLECIHRFDSPELMTAWNCEYSLKFNLKMPTVQNLEEEVRSEPSPSLTFSSRRAKRLSKLD